MGTSRATGLRNEALKKALAKALETGDRYVLVLLIKHGNLPGPQPNNDLAVAFGDALAAAGARGNTLLDELLHVESAGTSAEAFLPYVGAQTLASRIAARHAEREAWGDLYMMAGDPRRVVRDGVVASLARLAPRGDLALALASWTDGFLHAAVALEALAKREVLEGLHDADALMARLDEAWTLAEEASRAAERSQGRRRLLEVLGITCPVFAQRVPQIMDWLVARSSTKQPEVRTMLEIAIGALDRAGASLVDRDRVRRAIDGAAPPLRDPTDYRGPTRGRGRKAKRRAVRR